MTDPTEPADPAGPLIIAIDGPSGSGKSSVARAVASALGLEYLDTGAMYRALAWWCLERGTDLEDREAVGQAAADLPLEMGTNPAAPSVMVEGAVIDEPIRTTWISEEVSTVATNLGVREEMARRQLALIHDCSRRGWGVVAEGRDITTVVAPDADVRVLLEANEEARLARRSQELHGNAESQSLQATREQIVRRDRDDSTVSEFFAPAEGVVGIDTSDLTLEQSVDAVLDVVARVTGRPRG